MTDKCVFKVTKNAFQRWYRFGIYGLYRMDSGWDGCSLDRLYETWKHFMHANVCVFYWGENRKCLKNGCNWFVWLFCNWEYYAVCEAKPLQDAYKWNEHGPSGNNHQIFSFLLSPFKITLQTHLHSLNVKQKSMRMCRKLYKISTCAIIYPLLHTTPPTMEREREQTKGVFVSSFMWMINN